MKYRKYLDQVNDWPEHGKHILAQFDDDSVYVYQAYRPSIAKFAVENQRFGGEFSFSRMNWIKPNFLWMMYRSGWASKEGQEHILAVRLRRAFFDELLCSVVPSSFDPQRFATREEWQEAVKSSEVRLGGGFEVSDSGRIIDDAERWQEPLRWQRKPRHAARAVGASASSRTAKTPVAASSSAAGRAGPAGSCIPKAGRLTRSAGPKSCSR